MIAFRSLLGGVIVVAVYGIVMVSLMSGSGTDARSAKPFAKGLSPQDEKATFQLARGFRAELVAAEPNVIDPVAINFDEEGRMYVTEMPGYPNDGVATGTVTSEIGRAHV